MVTRKSISTEQLAKVLEFTLEELRKDLAVNKTTTEQNQKRFLEHLDSIYNKDLNIDLTPFYQANANFNNDLKNTLNRDNSFYTDFKRDLIKSIQESTESLERQKNDIKKAKKGIYFIYIGCGLISLSVLLLYLAFSIGFKNKSDIREEYKKELTEKGQYNTKENAIYLEKFRYWIKKNPKDSQILNNSIEKYWEKK